MTEIDNNHSDNHDNDYRPEWDPIEYNLNNIGVFLREVEEYPDPDISWRNKAACDDEGVYSHLFFSDNPTEKEKAKEICRTCPVTEECLKSVIGSINLFPIGIWGGLESSEIRSKLRSERTKRLRHKRLEGVEKIAT